MSENQNSNHILEEQEAKKQQALQELKELQALLGRNKPQEEPQEPVVEEPAVEQPAAAPQTPPAPEPEPTKMEESKPVEQEAEQETVLLEHNLFRKAQEEQQKQEEAARRERIRRTSPSHPPRKAAAASSARQGKDGKPRPVRKISREEAERRRKARRRRSMIRIGSLCILLILVVIAAAFSIHRSRKANESLAGAGSAEVVVDNGSQEPNTVDLSIPASQQESEKYLEIKDDEDLPSYAKDYPGLYSDARDVTTEESEEKVCYLTFDDGPSESVTPSILNTLDEYGVKATFFIVASQIPGNEALVERMVEDGHSLCIHAYVHEYETLYDSVEAYLEDFAQAYDAIYEATGYRVQGFRFPGGSNNGYLTSNEELYDAIVTEMTRRGFEYYDWNAYDGDAEGSTVPEPSSLVSRAVEEVNESSRNDVILLMHDTYGKENTASALPGIIKGLKEDGIAMLPLTNSSRPVHFEVTESTPSEYSGITEDLSEDTDTSENTEE